MRSLLIGLLAVLVSCSSAPAPDHTDRGNVLSDIQFIQNGLVLEPTNGVISLARSPFHIRYKGKELFPSVFVSANPKVKEQFRQLRTPLVTLNGTGSAGSPSDLYVTEDQMEIYDGWSPNFDKGWAPRTRSQARADFVAFLKNLPGEPVFITSGRNYINFTLQADGSRVYEVSQINGEAIAKTHYGSLYFLFFTDNFPPSGKIQAYLLHWAPLVATFSDS